MPIAPANSFWTKGRTGFLRNKGRELSALQIAQVLGCSRNAVIAKSWRMGGLLGWKKGGRIWHEGYVPVIKRRWHPRIRKPRPPPAAPAPPKNLALIELTRACCHWPVTDGVAPFLFCGHRVDLGESYCPYHRKLSRDPNQRRH